MPTEILGLPLHPLAVHIPVVLVPLFALLAIVFSCVPRVRKHCAWLLCILAVMTPLAAATAALSGDPLALQLLGELAEGTEIADETKAAISTHATYGGLLMWTTILLGILCLVLLFLVRRERVALTATKDDNDNNDENPTGKPRRIGQIVVTVFIVPLSALAMFLVYNAGHSGAEMVWGA